MNDQDAGLTPEPQGRLAGLPYDFRRLTGSRMRARAWNPGDPRVFTPKAYGWGFGVNWYWLVHPVRLVRARRGPADRRAQPANGPRLLRKAGT